jgi:hypothetical protein
MNEKRRHVRYPTKATARLSGRDEPDYRLKDISIGGCCIRYPGDPDMVFEITRECQITIIPEPEAQIEPFDLRVEPCWFKDTDGFHEVGCFIISYPEGSLYQRFANYLARLASLQ